MTELAIITVAHRSSSVLDEFITSARTASSGEFELHIADNSLGQDPELKSVLARHSWAILHELPTNDGYGAAVNAVVATVSADVRWIVIVNPDVSFSPGSLDTLVDATRRHPSGGAFGPTILTPDGDVYPSARSQPSLRTGIGHAIAHPIWPDNPWSRRYLLHDREHRERTAGWLSGACMLVSIDAFHAVGGFDERFFMYFEDVDLCRRLSLEGWENIYVPESVVTHTGAHSTGKSRERMIRAHHDSAYLFLETRYSGPWLAPVRFLLRLGLAVRARVSSRRSGAGN